MSETKTTFLLADDHSLIRQGLVFMLEEIGSDYEILQATNLSQILETVKANEIDFAIIDAHFPDGNSLSILPKIKEINPNIKIMIFTGIDEATQSLKFINAGANGFLSKLSEEEEIKQAILRMLRYGQYISPVTQELLMSSMNNPQLINPLKSLTEREIEIAELYAKGLGNLEIASRLDLKQNTISTVKKRIFEKLNIENIVELAELIKNNHD
ncbi:MAG: response regulator transcription factor [Chryseobacterium sp.]|uniref:Two component transcriptional regulator, LuxR family n=1 Tax=Epilithonimonas pallida TaxID=373671 RepID=A0ABY1R6D7_9FLAO|nr:response regulator transcription factor [Epilithonimonas pallida]MBN9337428.1 response regulator transcription factor [Chryseobacterium sp.]OJX28160.1 MAG: DNA-binding response regulator [Chryseobacterium sp. 36-9]SMP97135.1 two component transcriptional regulator, LuxR family [Epilithonimonas pallida]